MFADRLRDLYRLWAAAAPRGVRRTQEDVAEAVGVSKSAISNYIAGRDEPGLEKIDALARFFGVHPGWLAFGWEPRIGPAPDAMPELGAAGDEVP